MQSAMVPGLREIQMPSRTLKTHCKSGHEFTPENTAWRIYHPDNPRKRVKGRICRQCNRDYCQTYNKYKRQPTRDQLLREKEARKRRLKKAADKAAKAIAKEIVKVTVRVKRNQEVIPGTPAVLMEMISGILQRDPILGPYCPILGIPERDI